MIAPDNSNQPEEADSEVPLVNTVVLTESKPQEVNMNIAGAVKNFKDTLDVQVEEVTHEEILDGDSKEAPDVETEDFKEETGEDFFDVHIDSLSEVQVVNIHEESFDIDTSTQKEGIDAQENVFKKHPLNDEQAKPNASLDSFVVKHKFPDDEKSEALEETAKNKKETIIKSFDILTSASQEADVDIQETLFNKHSKDNEDECHENPDKSFETMMSMNFKSYQKMSF